MANSKMTTRLNMFGHNLTSQHGEDGIIQYILQHISPPPKVCVDLGAWDGKYLSNTFSLWHDNGWKGILIEGRKERCDAIKRNYSSVYNIRVFNQFITTTGDDSIDSLFIKNGIDPNIGLISIDIDSCDYHVWKNMGYVDPHIVIIEHNHTIPGYVDYHDPEGEVFLRCSAKSLETLANKKGYKLVCCTVTNSLFVKKEIFDDQFFPDMPVEYLFDYSHCYPLKLSANTSTTGNNLIHVFYGSPSRMQKIGALLTKYFALLMHQKYKYPSREVLKECENAGLMFYP